VDALHALVAQHALGQRQHLVLLLVLLVAAARRLVALPQHPATAAQVTTRFAMENKGSLLALGRASKQRSWWFRIG
jgi:hypothetical protein